MSMPGWGKYLFLREVLFPSGSEEKLMSSVLRKIIDFWEGDIMEGASRLLSTGSLSLRF